MASPSDQWAQQHGHIEDQLRFLEESCRSRPFDLTSFRRWIDATREQFLGFQPSSSNSVAAGAEASRILATRPDKAQPRRTSSNAYAHLGRGVSFVGECRHPARIVLIHAKESLLLDGQELRLSPKPFKLIWLLAKAASEGRGTVPIAEIRECL